MATLALSLRCSMTDPSKLTTIRRSLILQYLGVGKKQPMEEWRLYSRCPRQHSQQLEMPFRYEESRKVTPEDLCGTALSLDLEPDPALNNG